MPPNVRIVITFNKTQVKSIIILDATDLCLSLLAGFALVLFFDTEDGSDMFPRNVGCLSTVFMALHLQAALLQALSYKPLCYKPSATSRYVTSLQIQAAMLQAGSFRVSFPKR